MFGINTKPFAFVCVLLPCFTAYLVPNKDVSGTQNTVKDITGLQKMLEKIKTLPDSAFQNGVVGTYSFGDLPQPTGPNPDSAVMIGALSLGLSCGVSPYPINLLRTDT